MTYRLPQVMHIHVMHMMSCMPTTVEGSSGAQQWCPAGGHKCYHIVLPPRLVSVQFQKYVPALRIAPCIYVYVPMPTSDMSGLQRCWLCLNRALYPGLLTPTYVAGNDIPGRVEEWHIPGKKASKRVCCRSQTRTIE